MVNQTISKKEQLNFLSQEPRLEDIMSSLICQRKLPTSTYKDIDKAVAIARKFNEEVVKPAYKDIDRSVQEDNEYIPHDFIKKANEWGFYSMWIPKAFGGRGLNMLSMYPFIEEIASVCVGLGNVIGVHYLGVASLCASWNIKVMYKVLKEVIKGEKTGNPCLISSAITEPEAGTDVEETVLLDKARIGTLAKKVDGGYRVTGQKVFISMGHASTWHILICYEDKKKPHETMIMLAVKNGMDGFSFGNHEKKMGQKACVASELIFNDCFVPDKYLCISIRDDQKGFKKSSIELGQDLIDFVVSSTRPGVGAFATGCARGAYETALDYARKKIVGGELLINHQWAQSMLAEMYKNVNMSRAVYMESAYTNSIKGMFRMMFSKIAYYSNKYLPKWYFTLFLSPIYNLKFITWFSRKLNGDWYPKEYAEVTSGWGSLSKFATTDIAITNSQMAIELMGIDGCRHDIGSEKFLRDGKLLQIYEGTNQLNRINLFKNLVGRNMPEVDVF